MAGKLSFASDYMEGAHPQILRRLAETNMLKTAGYGLDEFSASAKEKIRAACGTPDADIFFLVGGTQANAVMIDAILRPWQGVLSAETGHINTHEAGAVEFGGHRILALPHRDGKISADTIRAAVRTYQQDENRDHTVMPGMVYISHPTEYGTLYGFNELCALRAVCDDYGLKLYMDGARLGYGLAARGAELTLPDIARLTDVFTIGGTKVGALFGEAVVITNYALKQDFRYLIKRHGGMLAKGRLLGLQFDTLMTDGLYERISGHAIRLAMKLRAGIKEAGFPFAFESPTNQQFPVLPDALLERLSKKYSYSVWGKTDAEHTTVRFCTSWATREENVDALIADLKA